mgnify:CR=1 FL=1
MKTALVLMLCSSLAFAAEPVDVPLGDKPVTLTPREAHDEAVRVLTCERDLVDCAAEGKVSPMWLTVGIVAGVLKMPVQRFLFWCAVGKIPKMLLVAYAGAYSVDWAAQFLQ